MEPMSKQQHADRKHMKQTIAKKQEEYEHISNRHT